MHATDRRCEKKFSYTISKKGKVYDSQSEKNSSKNWVSLEKKLCPKNAFGSPPPHDKRLSFSCPTRAEGANILTLTHGGGEGKIFWNRGITTIQIF